MNFEYRGVVEGSASPVSMKKDVKSGAVGSINFGDLVRADDGNPGYVKKGANGDTLTLAPKAFYAISTSTDTAGADGYVYVLSGDNMVLSGTATTPANLSQARIDTSVTLDTSGDAQTIDENDTTTGFMKIRRPIAGASGFDTTNGYGVEVVVNY